MGHASREGAKARRRPAGSTTEYTEYTEWGPGGGGVFLASDRGRNAGWTAPLPPNRTGGSPAYGFPVSSVHCGIEVGDDRTHRVRVVSPRFHSDDFPQLGDTLLPGPFHHSLSLTWVIMKTQKVEPFSQSYDFRFAGMKSKSLFTHPFSLPVDRGVSCRSIYSRRHPLSISCRF